MKQLLTFSSFARDAQLSIFSSIRHLSILPNTIPRPESVDRSQKMMIEVCIETIQNVIIGFLVKRIGLV